MLKRQPPRLPYAYQGIVAARFPQPFDQFIHGTAIVSKLIFQGKDVFHFFDLLLRVRLDESSVISNIHTSRRVVR